MLASVTAQVYRNGNWSGKLCATIINPYYYLLVTNILENAKSVAVHGRMWAIRSMTKANSSIVMSYNQPGFVLTWDGGSGCGVYGFRNGCCHLNKLPPKVSDFYLSANVTMLRVTLINDKPGEVYMLLQRQECSACSSNLGLSLRAENSPTS